MKKIFCDRLREARGARPQGKCAELLGISQVSLSQWERGTREPNLDALERIAKIFCVSVDWLLGLSDARAPRPAPLPTDAAPGDAEALREEVARLREAVAARDAAISHLSTAVARLAAPLAACAGGASSESSSRTEGA